MLTVNSDIAKTNGLIRQSNKNIGSNDGKGFASLVKQGDGVQINGGSGDGVIITGFGKPGPGPAPRPEPYPAAPVAANEHGRIWNDPCFQGGDGGRFDIQGEAGKNYDLLSDSGLQLIGRFDQFYNDGTAVGETGLTVRGAGGETSEISFSKEGLATINGEAMEQGIEYALADGGTAVLNDKKLTVITAEGYTIEQQAKDWGDKFINIDVHTGADGVDNGRIPGGLLGHTFDADDVARNGKTGHGAQGEGAIDGVVQDYEMDCLFNNAADDQGVDGAVVINGGSGDDQIIVNGPVNGPVVIDGGSGDDVIIIGPESKKPEPLPAEPVAANETGKIKGGLRLHFTGGDGGKYDIQGEPGKIYDLLSDTGLQFRGRFDDRFDGLGLWPGGATVVGETGLTVGENWNSDHVNFRKDGSATINGQRMEESQEYELADGGTAFLENDTLTITTTEGYTIKQTAHGRGDRAYINAEVTTGKGGVDNGRMPDGLLGQTFDADDLARKGKTGRGAQGEGAIDGVVSDYEKPALDPLNDNRGKDIQEDQAPGKKDEFHPVIEQFKELFNHLMEKLEKLKGGDLPKQKPVPKSDIQTDAGSGDDEVEIRTGGNHTVNLGSGDDSAYVNFEDGETGNTATIHGGSGDDTVTLAGSEEDYSVSSKDGYTVFTDNDNNEIFIADDVEQVRFEESEAA